MSVGRTLHSICASWSRPSTLSSAAIQNDFSLTSAVNHCHSTPVADACMSPLQDVADRDNKPLRTPVEREVGRNIERIFSASPDPVEVRLENFPKYVRRQHLKRFLAMYELFKRALPVKGSIVECGVFRGFGLMSWAKLSTILEPENLTRRIYGFDTFAGFPKVNEK